MAALKAWQMMNEEDAAILERGTEMDTGRALMDGSRLEPHKPEVFPGLIPHCWIAPDGSYYPVAYSQHETAAPELWESYYPDKAKRLAAGVDGWCDLSPEAATETLEDLGWARLHGSPAEGYYFLLIIQCKPTAAQRDTYHALTQGLRALAQYDAARGLEGSILKQAERHAAYLRGERV